MTNINDRPSKAGAQNLTQNLDKGRLPGWNTALVHDGVRLMHAFSRIENAADRAAIIDYVEKLALGNKVEN